MDGCPERSHNPGRLREHFMYWHCTAKVAIPQEGLALLPQSGNCGMKILVERLELNMRTSRYEKATYMHLRQRYMEILNR